ncbi:MutS family DNA mismatch repair protein [Nemorincola caseinilytica]|uniref:MutS family DNA mismatch repair protein n=1 Tax=Nemorincola caseinilytica TaxID=2054315 RepID=A0ABP8ND56_9BACT
MPGETPHARIIFMQNDKTTLRDLAVFPTDGSEGIFSLIDRTTTQEGREALRRHVLQPPGDHERLAGVQAAVQFWCANAHLWPTGISNGTLVMLEKFFESADNTSMPPKGFAGMIAHGLQKIFNKREYFFTKFSLSHLSDFLKGCQALAAIADRQDVPPLLLRELQAIKDELAHRLTDAITGISEGTPFPELSQLQYKARREMKNTTYRLIAIYARLDAWQAMARATTEHGWTFPQLLPELPVCLEATGIYHPLLHTPVAYDVAFGQARNFMLLTGANMSGKTTFLRSLGIGSLLAHLGMGVPAAGLRTSFMQGIITNMHAEDNILKGESYFFAEVQRMKQIARQLGQQRPHLALMDELFKGTNVHDAYECTKAVVDGLMNHPNHIMALSTHLYEVAQVFNGDSRILFYHFVTNISAAGQYVFTYKLREGISNDRIGYLILQQEGVIDMLRNHSQQ